MRVGCVPAPHYLDFSLAFFVPLATYTAASLDVRRDRIGIVTSVERNLFAAAYSERSTTTWTSHKVYGLSRVKVAIPRNLARPNGWA